jgi:hypothetical protein
MEENPVIINPENLLPPLAPESHFVFKKPEDWRSIIPYRERQEQLKHQRLMKRKMTMKISDSQEATKAKEHQFRIREKSKELHAPMRYGSPEKSQEEQRTLTKSRKAKDKHKKKRDDESKHLSRNESNAGLIRESTFTASAEDETEYNTSRDRAT